MSSIPEKHKSLSKLAQIYNAFDKNFALQNIEKIILKDGNINHKIPPNSFIKSVNPELTGGTALHIALSHSNYQVVKLLLNQSIGADYTIKNDNGSTPLHYIASSDFSSFSNKKKLEIKPFIDAILSAHVESKNSANPRDNNGLSHLHIACMVNHINVIKLFLDNDEDVNQIVNVNASFNPGCTPLHLAIKCYNTETVETLLLYGANVFLMDSKGMTPLHLSLGQMMDACGSTDIGMNDEFSISDFKDIKTSEQFIDLLLEKIPRDQFIVDETGLSRFHIACTSQDTSIVERILEYVDDINHSVSTSSRLWPGYTGLHFAAHCNANTVKMLVTRGADLEVKDACGVSPFDICLRRCKISDIHSIVSQKPEWKDTLLSDGKVRLSELLFAMGSADRLKRLLQSNPVHINACLPNNSKLWPGYTPLHLAVTLIKQYSVPSETELDLALYCLSPELITAKDSHGRTPLNLAFRENKTWVVDLLLRHHHESLVNPCDEDNLSHLHIACDVQKENLVEDLLYRTGGVNVVYKGSVAVSSIKPGYTPLHIAVAKRNSYLVKILMRYGADVNFADLAGHTPIHETFYFDHVGHLAKQLLSSRMLQERVVDGDGLSHLHVASANRDVKVVEKLLELGANVDAAYKGTTALHVAVTSRAPDVVVRLLERGADILARNDEGSTPLSAALGVGLQECFGLLISRLQDDEHLQARVERLTGVTKLHLACHSIYRREVKSLLSKGADANARVNGDSMIWPGCTPLHVLSFNELECIYMLDVKLRKKIFAISEILIDAGADVAVGDVKGHTPIHVAFDLVHTYIEFSRVRQLMKRHRDFSVNPINAQGLSHFHLACMVNDVAVVEKFLQHGADVNEPIGFFSDQYPGCYPIHLAMDADTNTCYGSAAQLETVDLLLKYGANVRAENSHGYTALHYAARAAPDVREQIIERILSAGANIDSVTIRGETPLELLLLTEEIAAEEIRFFIKHNARINSHNSNSGIGYLSMLLSKTRQQTTAFEEIMKAPDIVNVDERGRSPMHNAVTTAKPNISTQDYVRLFDRFTKLGCDVDDQDTFGYTALHLASQFSNRVATLALLTSGADVNIIDLSNKSAFSHAIEICEKREKRSRHRHTGVVKTLALHLQKLQLLGLDVSPLNASLKETHACPRAAVGAKFHEQVKVARQLEIAQTSFVAADFLRETKLVIKYPYLSSTERNAVDEFFENIDGRGIELLRGILMLQYTKAVKRFQLIDLAMAALRSLLGCPLTESCCEVVFGFLRNADLKSVIEASQ